MILWYLPPIKGTRKLHWNQVIQFVTWNWDGDFTWPELKGLLKVTNPTLIKFGHVAWITWLNRLMCVLGFMCVLQCLWWESLGNSIFCCDVFLGRENHPHFHPWFFFRCQDPDVEIVAFLDVTWAAVGARGFLNGNGFWLGVTPTEFSGEFYLQDPFWGSIFFGGLKKLMPSTECGPLLGGGFKYFFIFTPTWGRFPFWLIFFNWVETTNQFRDVYDLDSPTLGAGSLVAKWFERSSSGFRRSPRLKR